MGNVPVARSHFLWRVCRRSSEAAKPRHQQIHRRTKKRYGQDTSKYRAGVSADTLGEAVTAGLVVGASASACPPLLPLAPPGHRVARLMNYEFREATQRARLPGPGGPPNELRIPRSHTKAGCARLRRGQVLIYAADKSRLYIKLWSWREPFELACLHFCLN